ncbi:MAG: HIT family protein [Chloroflexi bacterium]|nr:HIT family protein [Chloroflexota bacterium]
MKGCLACDLTTGRAPLTGGVIFESDGWLVEHCIGPLGVGTLIVKPRRHVERFVDLSPAEYGAFGRLVWLATAALRELLSPDQTYVCQWAHAGWTPGHIHFVIQPAWDRDGEKHASPGPFLQVDLFNANKTPPADEVEAFCVRVREVIHQLTASTGTSVALSDRFPRPRRRGEGDRG